MAVPLERFRNYYQIMITYKELCEAAADIYKAKIAVITIKGYQSSSTGETADVVLERRPGIYIEMLNASIRQLMNGDPEVTARPSDIDERMWTLACADLITSYGKSLQTAKAGNAEDKRLKSYTRKDGGWLASNVEKETVAIEDLQRVSKAPAAVDVEHRDDRTKAMAILRRRVAMEAFVGLIKLSPAKLDSLSVEFKE